MPLWLDLLRTPMAAPESPSLRRMRFTWQALCLCCALAVGFFAHVHQAIGRPAAGFVGTLLLATVLYTWLYLARKHSVDGAYRERVEETE